MSGQASTDRQEQLWHPNLRARPVARVPRNATGAEALAPSEQIKTASTPQYLTPEAVAALLSVSPSTVYRWAGSDATMPATRVRR